MDVAESNVPISETATKTIEGGIRALVRSNRSPNVTKPTDDVVAANDAMAAGATSIADIEKLMAELLVARDYLQAEGERVRRVNANYAHLAQTASASVKVIAESIGKWRMPEQVSGHPTPAAIGQTHGQAPSFAPDGEVLQELTVA